MKCFFALFYRWPATSWGHKSLAAKSRWKKKQLIQIRPLLMCSTSARFRDTFWYHHTVGVKWHVQTASNLADFKKKGQATREGSFCWERTRLTRGRHVWHAHEMRQRVLCRKSLYDTNLNKGTTSQHWMMKHQIRWRTTEISRSKSQSIGIGSQQ